MALRSALISFNMAFEPIAAPAQALLVTPPVNGYFVVKHGGKWQRLVVLEPVRG